MTKPGLTGWAQIHYRYGASVEDARRKLGYDLYYLKHRSVHLDLAVIIRTIGTQALRSRQPGSFMARAETRARPRRREVRRRVAW